ncbi:MAG: hypothetical protein JO000_25880 [Alphaproteobacteria bacterium]|nr:hypothetical protein [Alphaproteobacteria bacterium]
MKNYMIVRQQIADLARFQETFDRLKPKRMEAGLTDLGQFCMADAPDTIIVVMEVADVARAKAYWHSDVLAKGRAQAAIVGSIEAGADQVWLTDGLVRDRIAAHAAR